MTFDETAHTLYGTEPEVAMLVLQAVSAHTIWDGDTYTDDEINAIISEMESAVERDFK